MQNFEKSNRQIGAEGEQVAVDYLISQNFEIIARNYHARYGEIDIIAINPDGRLVFIEVKSAHSTNYGYPEDQVSPTKLAHLESAIAVYLEKHPEASDDWAFDVIAVDFLNDGSHVLRHYEDAL